MQWLLSSLLIGVSAVLSWGAIPVQAQVAEAQVNALVEALRQAAPQTEGNDGLYSDWQVLPGNIPRWSSSCTNQTLTPEQFDADPTAAREIIACVMQDVLQEEYSNSGEEAIAVRRSAAWWMTGDPQRYNQGETASYTERVLNLYQQQLTAVAPTRSNPVEAAPATAQTSAYDRYMQAGYTATDQENYDRALLFFQRALDERPGDSYAQQAIENVEGYRAE
ncbi:MAG: hypothetical protein Kow00121_37030 [Elainellaceae cyanobacterium]